MAQLRKYADNNRLALALSDREMRTKAARMHVWWCRKKKSQERFSYNVRVQTGESVQRSSLTRGALVAVGFSPF
jgi:hypothetical protein